MKKSLYILIFFPFFLISQNASQNKETVSEKTTKLSVIERQFSKPVVLAYQDQAVNTIKDFYNYINLYKEVDSTSALEKEIDQSIENLFLNTAITLKNVFKEAVETIPLNEFLTKCKAKSVSILVSDFQENNTVSDTFFTFQYKMNVTIDNKTANYIVNQKVYFFPSEKQFGTQSKQVWQLKLGDM